MQGQALPDPCAVDLVGPPETPDPHPASLRLLRSPRCRDKEGATWPVPLQGQRQAPLPGPTSSLPARPVTCRGGGGRGGTLLPPQVFLGTHVLQCTISQEPGGQAPAQPGITLEVNVRPWRTGKQAGCPAPRRSLLCTPPNRSQPGRGGAPRQASMAEAPPPLVSTLLTSVPQGSASGRRQEASTDIHTATQSCCVTLCASVSPSIR